MGHCSITLRCFEAHRSEYIQDWTVIIAGALMGTLPTIVVFIFHQRYFLGGLTLGSTK